jgi:hypothetical protein
MGGTSRLSGAVRRLLTAVAIVAAAVAVPAPAQAHAGLTLVVNHDGRGSVSVDVAWADGHPVTEPIAGTLLGIGPGGAQVGPVALTRLPGTATVIYEGALPPGSWQVTVDVALPAIGRCAAPVAVAAPDRAAKPGTTRCASSPPPAAAAAAAAPASAPDPGRPVWLIVLVVVAAGAAVIAGAAWWRRARVVTARSARRRPGRSSL